MVAVPVQTEKGMCCIQRETGTVSQHGGRACIFNVNISICWRKTGNEDLITMFVCRDMGCFRIVSMLAEKNSDIGRTKLIPHGSSSKSRHTNLPHSFVWNYTDWTNASNGRIQTENIQVEQRWNQTCLHCCCFLHCDVMPRSHAAHPVNTSQHSSA